MQELRAIPAHEVAQLLDLCVAFLDLHRYRMSRGDPLRRVILRSLSIFVLIVTSTICNIVLCGRG